MNVRQFTEYDVCRVLTMPAAIECLRRAFIAYGKGEAQNQPRRRLVLPAGSVLHSMAAAYDGYFGTKVYSTNIRHGAHFTFLLFDAATARPLAQFEANHLGQIRTGAASGLAASILTPEDPLNVGIIGSGFQARTQIDALRAIRQIARVRVWSRSAANRNKFAQEVGGEAVDSATHACEGATVIVTATHAKDPVLPAEAVSDATLLLAMGSNWADRREIPEQLVKRARVVVDDLEQCRIEAGDLILAGIDWKHAQTLGELLLKNEKAGGNRRLTLFKSVGIALEDVAVAAYVYEQAILAQSSADPSPSRR